MNTNGLPSMNAVVLHRVGQLRYETVPVPATRPGYVRVRVHFCGVCGSDLPRCFEKGTYSFPTICGHEFSGIVDECGPDVNSVRQGDRVVVFPLLWNDDDPACEKGLYHQSLGYDYLGSRSDGGFAEFVIAPERNLIKVPGAVSLEEAAMTEPAAVALHAVRRSQIQIGQSAAVFGLGPIGLMVALWLRMMCVRPIILFDVQDYKLELASSLGFEFVFDVRKHPGSETVDQLTAKNGAHICIEAAGVQASLLACLQSTRRAGRVVLLGNPSSDYSIPAPLVSQVMRREIEIVGTWNSEFSMRADDDDWRTTLSAMAEKQLDLARLISHRIPLGGAIDALHAIRSGDEPYSKVMFTIGSELSSVGGAQ